MLCVFLVAQSHTLSCYRSPTLLLVFAVRSRPRLLFVVMNERQKPRKDCVTSITQTTHVACCVHTLHLLVLIATARQQGPLTTDSERVFVFCVSSPHRCHCVLVYQPTTYRRSPGQVPLLSGLVPCALVQVIVDVVSLLGFSFVFVLLSDPSHPV